MSSLCFIFNVNSYNDSFEKSLFLRFINRFLCFFLFLIKIRIYGNTKQIKETTKTPEETKNENFEYPNQKGTSFSNVCVDCLASN